jgi:hypothetical protein
MKPLSAEWMGGSTAHVFFDYVPRVRTVDMISSPLAASVSVPCQNGPASERPHLHEEDPARRRRESELEVLGAAHRPSRGSWQGQSRRSETRQHRRQVTLSCHPLMQVSWP